MTASIQMQQHPRQGPTGAPFAVWASPPPLPHQARPLQGQLHPGITELEAVLFPQLLVEVPHVQIKILLTIQFQHFLDYGQRHPPRARLAPPPVVQPVIAPHFVAPLPPPHLPRADPHDLRRLPPHDPFPDRSQNHFLYLHRPLLRGPRVMLHAPSWQKALLYRRCKADTSPANYTGHIMC